MRVIDFHKVQPTDLDVVAVDTPNLSGIHHRYTVQAPNALVPLAFLNFQNCPKCDAGVNGITKESLIAICIDQLTALQAGPFPCCENETALEHLQLALKALNDRTRDRLQRGVEGTNQA